MIKEHVVARREKHALVEQGKTFLFKGLSTEAFGHYFRAGGIAPNPNPISHNEPWITNDVVRAQQFAGFGPLDGDRGCLAVINKPQVLSRGNLTPQRSLERVLSPSLKEYHGQELVGWDEVSRIFTTQQSLARIRRDHMLINPQDLSWEAFLSKVALVEKGDRKQLNRELMRFLIAPRNTSKLVAA